MIKIVLPVLIVSVIISALVYRFIYYPEKASIVSDTSEPSLNNQSVPSSNDLASRVSFLESAISLLNDKIKPKVIDKNAKSQDSSVDAKLNSLQDQIADLNSRLTKLESPSPLGASPTPSPTAQPGSSQPTNYIPIGSSAASGDRNWFSVEGFFITLNPADFKGYSGMKLEVTGKLAQAAGTASYRLYNETDSSGISASEVSTTSDKYVLLTSSGFQLPTGTKTYRLQIKSSLGYDAWAQLARIRVDF